MSQRVFASWVEPVAAQHRESRQELVDVARSLPADAWSHPSPLDGWTYKDLLAHLAGDTGKTALQLLRSIAVNRRVDPAFFEQLGKDVDARNERDVLERRGRPVEELVAEIEADGEAWDELFAQLGEDDRDLRQEGIPLSLGEALSASPGGHARGHLSQLRTALESQR